MSDDGKTTDEQPATAVWQPSNLIVRIVVGVALITIAVLALWFGGIVLWLLASAAGLLMMAEWADLAGAQGRQKQLAIGALAIGLLFLVPFGSSRILSPGPSVLSLAVIVLAALASFVVTRRQQLAAGVLYVGAPVLALLLIRDRPDGILFTLWALATVWMTDIGAYFAGRAIGGPKLAPKLSPSKTWAGLIGGVALASLFAAFLHWAYGLPLRLTIATPVLAVAAQAGDLFESWLKRRAGVKDSGNLLPGHGGVLDRLDGLVPVAPLAALLVVAPQFYR